MRHLAEFYEAAGPLLLQQFVQHDGVVIKVYVLDGQIHLSARPSFKNLHSSQKAAPPMAATLTDIIHFRQPGPAQTV